MRKPGNSTYKQGEILLVPFPFADQSGKKVRPVIVVSNNNFNASGDDLIVCAITTRAKPPKYSVMISHQDLEEGILHEKGAVKIECILKIKKNLVIKSIGLIRNSVCQKIINILKQLF